MPKRAAVKKRATKVSPDFVLEIGPTHIKPPSPKEIEAMKKRELQRRRDVI